MVFAAFWTSFALLVYVFLGYPLITWVFARIAGKKSIPRDDFSPSASVLLSVYNEEAIIGEKIHNFLALDYPRELLEFLIISDCSEDKTDGIIRSFRDPRIKLLVQEQRAGKTTALNRGVAAAQGEVLVFTDANSMFDRDAIQKLVRHFADPSIGLVSGKSIYVDSGGNEEQTSGAYRRYENYIMAKESSVCSIIGADGAIYAMRKSLYESLKPEYINDFIHPIQVVLKKSRAIVESASICRERVDETYDDELNRQTRIMAQSWLIFLSQIGKLIAGGRWLYLWELCSHKFLRWLSIPIMLLLFLSNLMLTSQGMLYRLSLYGQIGFWLLVLIGKKLQGGIFKIPLMFVLLHYAALPGFIRLLSGNLYTTWNPRNS